VRPHISLRWRVLLVVSLAAVVPTVVVGSATRDLALLGIAAFVLAVALGAWLAATLTRPLRHLARRTDAIATGQTSEAAPITGPGEIGVLAHAVDEMTKRIAERAELAAALARGDRLASVGVLAAQVAHEINQPLTTVLDHATHLLADKPENHPDRKALERIVHEASRMQQIISGLLPYARVPRTAEQACEPATIVRQVAALVAPQLTNARAQLVTEVPAGDAVAIEAQALHQVLVTLVQNAVQTFDDGGTITIRAQRTAGGNATQISVADNGLGIPAADRTRVFDPFFTTTARSAGTALGLAVCKHLVATAGGSIEVADGPHGRGAEFRVTIPNAD
jgi:two-component system, NtrC family, sensor kinase